MSNIFEAVQQLRADPIGMLSKRFNIPADLPMNPNEILQYLLNSGQVSQQQINNAMQMRKQFFRN